MLARQMVQLDRQIDLAAREHRWLDGLAFDTLREQVANRRYEIARRAWQAPVTDLPGPLRRRATRGVG